MWHKVSNKIEKVMINILGLHIHSNQTYNYYRGSIYALNKIKYHRKCFFRSLSDNSHLHHQLGDNKADAFIQSLYNQQTPH